MTDEAPGNPRADDDDHGRMVRLYLTVFVALFLTPASFVANYAASEEIHWISQGASFVIVLGVAVVKAALVGYVMHLMADWRKLYFMIFPAFILGAMMMFVFLPEHGPRLAALTGPESSCRKSPPVGSSPGPPPASSV